MRFRCMMGDRFIDVEAQSQEEAQELAFARTVRDLRPQDFMAWETGAEDPWGEEAPA